jgi:hypothetical protein
MKIVGECNQHAWIAEADDVGQPVAVDISQFARELILRATV